MSKWPNRLCIYSYLFSVVVLEHIHSITLISERGCVCTQADVLSINTLAVLENRASVSNKSVLCKKHNPHFSPSQEVLWWSVSGLGRERESLWCVMGFEILEKALKDQKGPKVGGGDAEMCIVLSIQSHLLPSRCLLISTSLLCFVLTLAFFLSLFTAESFFIYFFYLAHPLMKQFPIHFCPSAKYLTVSCASRGKQLLVKNQKNSGQLEGAIILLYTPKYFCEKAVL